MCIQTHLYSKRYGREWRCNLLNTPSGKFDRVQHQHWVVQTKYTGTDWCKKEHCKELILVEAFISNLVNKSGNSKLEFSPTFSILSFINFLTV